MFEDILFHIIFRSYVIYVTTYTAINLFFYFLFFQDCIDIQDGLYFIILYVFRGYVLIFYLFISDLNYKLLFFNYYIQ